MVEGNGFSGGKLLSTAGGAEPMALPQGSNRCLWNCFALVLATCLSDNTVLAVLKADLTKTGLKGPGGPGLCQVAGEPSGWGEDPLGKDGS